MTTTTLSDDQRNVMLQMIVTWQDRLHELPKEQEKLLDQWKALRQEESDTKLAMDAVTSLLTLAGVDIVTTVVKKDESK